MFIEFDTQGKPGSALYVPQLTAPATFLPAGLSFNLPAADLSTVLQNKAGAPELPKQFWG